MMKKYNEYKANLEEALRFYTDELEASITLDDGIESTRTRMFSERVNGLRKELNTLKNMNLIERMTFKRLEA